MIYTFVGESGSGKDTLARYICDNFNYEKVVLYTTRPIREGEEEGTDYYFIEDELFDELEEEDFFLTVRTYNGWKYGVQSESVYGNPDVDKIICLSPEMSNDIFCEMITEHENDCIEVYVRVQEVERLCRQLSRGDDKEEIVRRLVHDRIDFKDITHHADFILDNEVDVPFVATSFLKFTKDIDMANFIVAEYHKLGEFGRELVDCML